MHLLSIFMWVRVDTAELLLLIGTGAHVTAPWMITVIMGMTMKSMMTNTNLSWVLPTCQTLTKIFLRNYDSAQERNGSG